MKAPRPQPPGALVKALRPLPRAFFARHTVIVARSLLGHLLVHETPQGRLVGRIVETEAYRGHRDPASHAYRRTSRSEIMFGRPGIAYVYLSYGVHRCLNVVTEAEGQPGAVLLRAVEPLEGIDLMLRRPPGTGPGLRRVAAARGFHQATAGGSHRVAAGRAFHRVGAGPGRLTAAMRVRLVHNGADLTRPPLYIADGGRHRVAIAAGPRIGVSSGASRAWRFGIARHASLSRPFRPAL